MSEINRIIDSIRRIIRAEFPNYMFHGIYEYAIQAVNSDDTVNIDPTDTTLGLPSHRNIRLQEEVKPTVGNLCLLVFVNGKPSKPLVLSSNYTNDETTIDATTLLELGPSSLQVQIAGGGQPVGRVGDTILAGGFLAGTITSGSLKTSSG